MNNLRLARNGAGIVEDGGIFPLANSYLPPAVSEDTWGLERVSPELLEANEDDDTYGAGLFDERNNVHAKDGIFADRFSLPGYLAREPGTGPSEVIDWQTGTPIASVAAGLRTMQPNMASTAPRYPLRQGIDFPDVASLADLIDFNNRIPTAAAFEAGEVEPPQGVSPFPMTYPPGWAPPRLPGVNEGAIASRFIAEPIQPGIPVAPGQGGAQRMAVTSPMPTLNDFGNRVGQAFSRKPSQAQAPGRPGVALTPGQTFRFMQPRQVPSTSTVADVRVTGAAGIGALGMFHTMPQWSKYLLGGLLAGAVIGVAAVASGVTPADIGLGSFGGGRKR